jgi:hypothetical protein
MSTDTTTVPVTMTPKAEAYIAELGMKEPCEQMLDYIRQNVSGLRSITVNLQEPYDLGPDPCVIFDVVMADPHVQYDPTEKQFELWQIDHFPPEVLLHFVMLVAYE